MRRRDLVLLLGGMTALSRAARAQKLPIVGMLDSRSSGGMASRLLAFRRGLKEAGLAEGEDVTIVTRWAENRIDRLPDLAADLVRQRPAVIFTSGGPTAALAAKAATTSIPVVFLVGDDPTRLGLVDNLSRPSGNLTGFNLFANEMEAKRLALLHQLVPGGAEVALLVNPADAWNTENTLREVSGAARQLGMHVRVLKTATPGEIDDAFAAIESKRPDALFVGAAAFLNTRRVQLVQLAAFHRLPASFAFREAADAGGLMSYGPSIVEAYRQCGMYAGRLLRGARPEDLPVMQASRFELIINLATARLLGISAPPGLLALADEVIE
jgi:putative ABC transport system substrate-binding protein